MSLMGAYGEDEEAEDEGDAGSKQGAGLSGGQATGKPLSLAGEGGMCGEVTDGSEAKGKRKRGIRWLDEESHGNIESYDCKRQKAVDAAKNAAAAPLSPWALKLKEEQKAFAVAMANMQPEDDEP